MPVPLRFLSRRAAVACVLSLLLTPAAAWAHAILEASEPAAGATVAAGPLSLKLRFNSRIDRARSVLTLTGPDKAKTVPPIDAEGPPDILTTTVTLTPGAYVLRWQVLAVDGHITRGNLPFIAGGK